MKNAIVSGANGFIGSALVRELIQHDVHVVALTRKGHTNNVPVSNLVTIVPFDMDNSIDLLTDLPQRGFDVFFHLAWSNASGLSSTNVPLQLRNVQNTIDCMKIAKALGCRRFVNSSSILEIEAYRATLAQGNRPGASRFVYGASKLSSHIICECLASELDMGFISALVTNAYGPGEVSARMVNTAIRKCIYGENPQFTSATQLYDFVYINDVARAFRLIGEKGTPFHEYTIGSSNARPLKDFLLEMKSAIAPNLDFVFGSIPYTGGVMLEEDFDCSETERDTGFRASISFGEGCIRTRDWLVKDMQAREEPRSHS